MDLGSKGCAFTLTNNRHADDLVKERLDIMLCTKDWRLAYPLAKVLALPTLGSDHSPLLLSTKALSDCKRQKSFYFEAFWLQDMECARSYFCFVGIFSARRGDTPP